MPNPHFNILWVGMLCQSFIRYGWFSMKINMDDIRYSFDPWPLLTIPKSCRIHYKIVKTRETKVPVKYIYRLGYGNNPMVLGTDEEVETIVEVSKPVKLWVDYCCDNIKYGLDPFSYNYNDVKEVCSIVAENEGIDNVKYCPWCGARIEFICELYHERGYYDED